MWAMVWDYFVFHAGLDDPLPLPTSTGTAACRCSPESDPLSPGQPVRGTCSAECVLRSNSTEGVNEYSFLSLY